jgi:cytochrome b6
MSPGQPPERPRPSLWGRFYWWLDERYRLESLIQFLGEKSVPTHGSMMWYYCGGATLFFFVVQVVTGILLLMYYVPSADSAYESIHFIMSKVQFGWLIRSIHSWSANLMILAAFIHLFSVFFTISYRRPRELTWLSGMIMLFLALGFGFSGYLLPWNELSFFATKVGTDMVGKVPFVGRELLVILRGGDDVTGATLTRFFGIHVAILPGIFTVFLAAHLLFVQRQGISEPLSWEKHPPKKPQTMRFFPNFVLRDVLFWIILVNILAILAVFFPWELGEKADPFQPAPAGIKPEWYFMFVFQSLKKIPARVLGIEGELLGISVFSLIGLAAMLLPFWDRAAAKGKRSTFLTVLAILALVFMIAMTIWGFWEQPPV